MNLAELRKKAQKENREDAGRPLPPPEWFDQADEPLIPAPVEFAVDEAPLPAASQAELPVEPVRVAAKAPTENTPDLFDPLAVLLAGREAACADETAFTGSEAAAEAGSDFRELLCFRVSSEVYAIDIMDIKEIVKPREVTEVPRAPAFVSGVLSLRGIIIPIFNMRLRLGLPGGKTSARERIVVLKKGEDFFGVLVDEVIQVVRIGAATIEKPPAVLDGIDRDFVSGIGRFDGQMLILLNQEKILDLTLG